MPAQEDRNFFSAFKTQRRIVGALLMREVITRYGRHNIGFMWLFIEPMMFTLGVLFMWTFMGLHKVQLPIVPFCLSGYATILLWRNTINRSGNAVEPNRTLLHHRNVRIINLFLARTILEIAGATMSCAILFSFFIFVGLANVPYDILKFVFAWTLLAWFSFDMSLILGALSTLSEVVERVWHVFAYLFLPLSGAFYMVEWLPREFGKAVQWVPIVNCTELLREGLFGPLIRAHYSITYVIIFNTIFLFFGLFLMRYISNRGVDGE